MGDGRGTNDAHHGTCGGTRNWLLRGAVTTDGSAAEKRSYELGAESYQDWYIGLALSFVVIVVVVIIVAIILTRRPASPTRRTPPSAASTRVRAQTTSLDGGIDKVNDSAIRILHMARVLRKAAVGS